MADPLSDRIIRRIDQASKLYHRLIILVSPTGTGKTIAIRKVRDRISAPLVNVNLELSQLLLSLTERQRALQLPHLFAEIVEASGSEVVLLDNIEVLFDVSLKQDPLRLMQGLSRNRTLIVAWSGSIVGEHLVYATPNHPEYRRYLVNDLLVLTSESVV